MSTTLMSTLLAALAAATLAIGVAAARADGHDDHDRIRAAHEAGRVLPLVDLLTRVRAEHPGAEVLEVELEEEHGRLIYEIKLLRPRGRLAELHYDAATGERVAAEDED
jgi:uncharacterized membrane protein YkoI